MMYVHWHVKMYTQHYILYPPHTYPQLYSHTHTHMYVHTVNVYLYCSPSIEIYNFISSKILLVLTLSDPMLGLVRHYDFPVPDAFLDL
jgi:hypothetical protein